MTVKDNKKAHISDALVGYEIQALQSAKADQHRDRITRFGILKHRSKLQENYLWTLAKYKENYQDDKPNEESVRATKSAQKLLGCGNFLLFKNFYTIDQTKLTKFQACNQHLLCPFCASIRASRSCSRYVERVDQLLKKNKKLKPVLITLTVKNGDSLSERFNHLSKSFKTLLERRRDYLKKGRGFNQFCKVEGAFYSCEYTYTSENGWHPHIHLFALIEDWINQEELSETWHEITGDSFIVDVRRVKKEKSLGYSNGVREVFKYALKFSELSVENTWEAFKTLKGKRLTGSFGILHGVKIPENLADELPDDKDLPYLEMLYKFVYGKQSYYDLASTRHVEPQNKDDDNEAEELRRQRGGDVISDVATDGRGTERTARRARTVERTVPQYIRKKKHWQVSPKVRVMVKHRIRRWDGYLYVIHI